MTVPTGSTAGVGTRVEPLRVLSLFAGIGGIDLGLERAGMEVVAHSEIDPYACRVLAKHWPDVPNLGDITTLDAAPWVGQVDVIAGGFPCQDISLAGKGAGIAEGTRSGLWSEYARLVRELRPRYVIVENVAALLVRGIDIVLGDLAALGFDAWWDCIPAAAVGAPHRRDRVFIVATRADVAPLEPAVDPMEWASAGTRADAGSITGWEHAGDAHGAEAAHEGRRAADDHEPAGVCAGAAPDAGHERREEPAAVSVATRAELAGAGGVGVPATDAAREHAERRAGDRPIREEQAAGRAPADHWFAEPSVGRLAHGIPNRVDRVRCLGNAVVPQVAEYVGRLVVEHHERGAA